MKCNTKTMTDCWNGHFKNIQTDDITPKPKILCSISTRCIKIYLKSMLFFNMTLMQISQFEQQLQFEQ